MSLFSDLLDDFSINVTVRDGELSGAGVQLGQPPAPRLGVLPILLAAAAVVAVVTLWD